MSDYLVDFDPARVVRGFSIRGDGSMYSKVAANLPRRDAYFGRQGIDPASVVTPRHVHGMRIETVGTEQRGTILEGVDGLITDVPGVTLTVTAADCLPIFFWDAKHHAVGIAHAGWRGVEAGIAPKLVEELGSRFGSDPTDILVAIGPSIQACHFEVQADVEQRFAAWPGMVRHEGGKMFVDLHGIIRRQLEASGILPEHIRVCDTCTYHEPDRYFSSRRDHADPLETMVGYIALKA